MMARHASVDPWLASFLLRKGSMMKRATRPKRKRAKLQWLRNVKGKRVGLILPA